ncbi:MAG: DUF58 domain-containing protein [Candidatus Aenigmarchaeota archaeon]|nr:DUF58 domain-containing protein [Candidatus Aenigmarchaeota archaeon]
MVDKTELIKDVRKVELKTRKLVNGLIQGQYYSCFKGRGIEFSEVREYTKNDDARSIDWNVTARVGKPYIKEFIEERNLDVFIIYDASGSIEFGSENLHKKRIAMELIASIVFSANKNNDNAGLFIVTEEIEKKIPLRKGKRHMLRILHEVSLFVGKKKTTDLRAVFEEIGRIVKRKSLMFIISDFMDDFDTIEKPLKQLNKKHDVIAVHLYDQRETEIPDVGLIELEDEESGEQILVDTSSEEFRKKYAELVASRKKEFKKMMNRCKIDIIDINTKYGWLKPIIGFFKKRGGRR